MKSIIVYHDTETLAHRAHRSRPDQTVAYRSVKQWSDEENERYDEVIDLSTKPNKTLKRVKNHVTDAKSKQQNNDKS